MQKKINFKKIVLCLIYMMTILLTLLFLYKTKLYGYLYQLPSFNISFIIIITSFVVYILNKDIFKFVNKKNALLFLILAFLFLFMLPINELYTLFFRNGSILELLYYILYILLLVISIIICLIKVFSFKLSNQDSDFKKIIKIINVIFIIVLAIYLFSSTTGYYDEDFPTIWEQNINGISNIHTFAYTILIIGLKHIFNNPYFIIVVQVLLWLFALNYSLRILVRETKSKKVLIIFSIIQLLLLVGFKQTVFLWKDSLFSIALYIIVISIIDCLSLKSIFKNHIIIFTIFGIIVSNFRAFGWLLILLFAMISLLVFYKNKYFSKIIVFCGTISVLSYFILNFICLSFFDGVKISKNTQYTVPIYQIGYFINNGYDFNNSEIAYFETLYPIEVWKNNFVLNDGDALARAWRIPNDYIDNFLTFKYPKTLLINMRLFLSKPIVYLKSLTGLSNVLWRISDDNYKVNFNRLDSSNKFKGNEFFATYLVPFVGKDGSNFSFKENYLFTKVINKIENILFYNSLLFNIKSRGGFALYILIISAILFIYKREEKYVLAIVPLLLWLGMLFISIPRSLTRYIIIFIISFPIIFLLALCKDNRINLEGKLKEKKKV